MHYNTNVIFLKLLCILNEISLALKNIIVNHQQFLYKKIKPRNNKIHSLEYRLEITGISKQTLYHVLKTKQIFQVMYLLSFIYQNNFSQSHVSGSKKAVAVKLDCHSHVEI